MQISCKFSSLVSFTSNHLRFIGHTNSLMFYGLLIFQWNAFVLLLTQDEMCLHNFLLLRLRLLCVFTLCLSILFPFKTSWFLILSFSRHICWSNIRIIMFHLPMPHELMHYYLLSSNTTLSFQLFTTVHYCMFERAFEWKFENL